MAANKHVHFFHENIAGAIGAGEVEISDILQIVKEILATQIEFCEDEGEPGEIAAEYLRRSKLRVEQAIHLELRARQEGT
jgi:hypothetical protein